MNERQLRVRVGLFVLAGLVLLAAVSVLFTGLFSAFKAYDDYRVVFNTAPGIGPGTPVRRSGVRIGQVKGVTLDEETGQVHVVLQIEKGHVLRHSDEATQARSLIGGDPTIDIVTARPNGRPPDPTPVLPGQEIAAAPGTDVRDLLTQTQELLPTTQEALNDIRKTLQRFERLTPQVEETMKEYRELAKAAREAIPDLRRTNDEAQVTARTWGRLGERLDVLVQTNQDKVIQALDNLNDTVRRVAAVFTEENQRNLAATLKNARAGTENLEGISKNTEAFLKDSRQTLERFNQSLTRTDDVLTNLQQSTRPIAERSVNITRNLDETADKLNRLLGEFTAPTRPGGQPDGSLRRFLNDPSLYTNLNDAACMLVRILPRVDRMLRDLEVFADKLARHPESIGLGGAIRPSAGLKESPTSGVHLPRD
jgi:phospholipid/cholesterol/gamma-HCH transport system substrate-binding protein